MKLRWHAVALMIALFLPAGCAKAPEASPVRVPTAKAEEQLSPAALRERALGYMSQGAYAKAIPDWSTLVQLEPTADNWNDLSFAYLQAGRYQEAANAAESALKLKSDHPYALYNAGLAYVENKQYCQALYPLGNSAAQQPDRYEPHLALARAYRGTGQYGLSAYHADLAAKLRGATPEVQAVQAAVAEMRGGAPPADFARASVAQLRDGALTLYLYPEAAKGCLGDPVHSLYLARENGQVQKIPVGPVPKSDRPLAIRKVALPGGYDGYWIEVNDLAIAYVAHASAWVLVAVKEQDLRQVLFASRPGVPRDTVDSGQAPSVDGDHITAARMDGASGTQFVLSRWQLQPDLSPARHLQTTYTLDGEIRAASGSQITVGRSEFDAYQLTFTLSDATAILQNGAPVPRSELKPKVKVTVTFERVDQVLRVELRQ